MKRHGICIVLELIFEILQLGLLMANAVFQGHQHKQYIKGRMGIPESSSKKEGLYEHIELLEQNWG